MKVKSVLCAFLPLYGAGVRFRMCLRLRELFRKKKWQYLAMCCKNYLQRHYGCELSVNAAISTKTLFMHCVGVVIGDGCIVEDGVVIYSGVCLGRKDINNEDDYPIIRRNSVLGTGSKILGKIVVEENTIIGANAVVLSSCTPGGGTYVGSPAHRVGNR